MAVTIRDAAGKIAQRRKGKASTLMVVKLNQASRDFTDWARNLCLPPRLCKAGDEEYLKPLLVAEEM